LAMRPGPRVQVPERLIATLREAILASRRIRLTYQPNRGNARVHLLEPCGLLYGTRPYLLAARVDKPDAAVWRLDRVQAAETTNEAFVPRAGFTLPALAAQSFGVWREAPHRVVLRFAGTAADEARGWIFHPSQTLEPQSDGALIVRFEAGGVDEMAYHFATWGDAVEVLEPPALRARLATLGQALVRRHGEDACPAEGCVAGEGAYAK